MTFRPLSTVAARLTADLYARRIELNAALEADVRRIAAAANARLDNLDRRHPTIATEEVRK